MRLKKKKKIYIVCEERLLQSPELGGSVVSGPGTCGGGWSMADTTSAGLFSGFSSSTRIPSCRPNVTFTRLEPEAASALTHVPARISPACV